MATMIKTLDRGIGYAGKHGERCWIARITGTDAQYGLAREFVAASHVTRDHYNRARTTAHYEYELEEDALYECSQAGERWIIATYLKQDGTVGAYRPSDARVKAWVALLDAGKTGREARLETKGL